MAHAARPMCVFASSNHGAASCCFADGIRHLKPPEGGSPLLRSLGRCSCVQFLLAALVSGPQFWGHPLACLAWRTASPPPRSCPAAARSNLNAQNRLRPLPKRPSHQSRQKQGKRRRSVRPPERAPPGRAGICICYSSRPSADCVEVISCFLAAGGAAINSRPCACAHFVLGLPSCKHRRHWRHGKGPCWHEHTCTTERIKAQLPSYLSPVHRSTAGLLYHTTMRPLGCVGKPWALVANDSCS